MIKKGLLYSQTHEWVKSEGNVAYVGITDYAQDTLGSIVFTDLPSVGDTFKKEEIFGAVESVKAASDLYAPISFKVLEVNDKLTDEPGLLNDDPYENWMLKVEILDNGELASLLDEDKYEACCQ